MCANPFGIRIPWTGVEQFDLRTPADAADPDGEVDKVEALEKNVRELEDSIKQIRATPEGRVQRWRIPMRSMRQEFLRQLPQRRPKRLRLLWRKPVRSLRPELL